MLLFPNSSLSQSISDSEEIKQIIIKHKSKLLNKEKVLYESTKFDSTNNLYLSLNYADIWNIHVDDNGNLRAFVIDTYDFNKGDLDWKIRVAYNIQENNNLENFFIICAIVIPKYIWMLY